MKLAATTVSILLALSAFGCTTDPPLDVADVELTRFEGQWYEIAKLPRPTQSDCTATTAFYRRKSPTELDVFNECREGSLDGRLRRVAARAVVTDPDVPAKLSIDFGGFFGDYWIVEVDSDYQHAVVGHPSRDYLWILSRTASMPEATFQDLSEQAQAKGFDVARLERTLQNTDEPSSAPASAASLPSLSDHGCSLGGGRPARTSAFGALLVALLAFRGFTRSPRRRQLR